MTERGYYNIWEYLSPSHPFRTEQICNFIKSSLPAIERKYSSVGWEIFMEWVNMAKCSSEALKLNEHSAKKKKKKRDWCKKWFICMLRDRVCVLSCKGLERDPLYGSKWRTCNLGHRKRWAGKGRKTMITTIYLIGYAKWLHPSPPAGAWNSSVSSPSISR